MKNTLGDWLILTFSTFVGVASQLCLKQAMQEMNLERFTHNRWAGVQWLAANGYFWAYAMSAVFSFLTWLWVVKRFHLSFIYPVSQSAAFILILFFSSIFFYEPMSLLKWIGILFISLGLFLCR